MAREKSLAGPAQRAEWMPGSPSRAGTTRPESSASAGSWLISAARDAFRLALASKVVPVSSGSSRPRAPALRISTLNGRSRSAISASFPLLWVAMTRAPPAKRRGGRTRSGKAESRPLMAQELVHALARQRQQRQEAVLGEGLLLRR